MQEKERIREDGRYIKREYIKRERIWEPQWEWEREISYGGNYSVSRNKRERELWEEVRTSGTYG